MNKYTWSILIAVIIIAGVSVYIEHSLTQRPHYTLVSVTKTNLTEGVTANGSVDAAQDLTLSFQIGGTVSQVPVVVGQQVTQDETLAELDPKSAQAGIAQATAALDAAQASYQKTLDGATSAQIQVAQAAVTAAQTALSNATTTLATTQAQQTTAVNNAYITLLNTPLSAVPGSGNSDAVTATITGTYTGTQQGTYNITLYATGGGESFTYSGLESGSGPVRTQPAALGTKGLYIQFSAMPSLSDTWTVSIPNTYAAAYVANSNAYQAALQTQSQAMNAARDAVNSAQAALTQAQASLALTQAAARPEDVAAAQAQVGTAQAALETAQNNYGYSFITAPLAGTITEVDAKIGQTASPGTPEIKMISGNQFQIDAYVSQNDLSKIKVSDPAQVTLDAYGDQTNFPATVIDIDPAATTINNVQSYKVTLQFNNNDSRIKTGMAANITITNQTKNGVLAIPQTAVITQNNQTYVLKQTPSGQPQQVQIQTGISGLNGMTEITSGLNEGDQIVSFGQ